MKIVDRAGFVSYRERSCRPDHGVVETSRAINSPKMNTIVPIQPQHYPWDLLLLADPSRSVVEGYLPGSVVLGNIEQGEVRGVVVIAPLSAVSWEIKNLAVSPRYQGKGMGKSLLRAALDLCEERGAQEVWIGTGNSSLNQLGLYQKMGFRMVEIVRDFFARNYAQDIVENGIQCRDMIRLVARIGDSARS